MVKTTKKGGNVLTFIKVKEVLGVLWGNIVI
jgi:hypothetical protein